MNAGGPRQVLVVNGRRTARTEADITAGGMANVWFVDAELVRRGVAVTVVTRATDAGSGASAGVDVTEVPYEVSDLPEVLDRDYREAVSFTAAIPPELLYRDWDVIHVHHWTSAAGLVERLPARHRVVYTPHLLAIEKARLVLRVEPPPHVRAAEEAILRRADVVICLSEEERARVVTQYGIDPERCVVIPNGAADIGEPSHVLRSDRDPGDSTIRVLSVGRIARQKGYDVLLAALPRIIDHLRLHVDIAGPPYGEPDYERELQVAQRSGGLPVHFLGGQPPSMVRQLLGEADMYVQPSRYESQGIAIHEAMASGLPVIVSDLPAIRSYCTHGVNAWLVPRDDPQALAEAIITLAADPELRARLGRVAAGRAAGWNWRDCGRATFDQLLPDGAPPRPPDTQSSPTLERSPTKRWSDVNDKRHDLPAPLVAVGDPGTLTPLSRVDAGQAVCGVTGSHRTIGVRVVSDNERLLSWYAANWPPAPPDNVAATIYAMTGTPADYGVQADHHHRLWDAGQSAVALFECDSYAIVKVTVRGVCSAVRSDAELFAHGCAFEVTHLATGDVRGVLLIGGSGAGKTTLVSALMADPEYRVRIVNDDWGVIDLDDATARFTGERTLHMKARSVLSFAPQQRRALSTIPTEGSSDPDDAGMRVLIEPATVFGDDGTADEVRLTDLVVLSRGASDSGATPDDLLAALEAGAYSEYYQRAESFFNGSLILTSDAARDRERHAFAALMTRLRTSWLWNQGSKDELNAGFKQDILGAPAKL
jgi:D-inositol-3-phosphate glycosyltransferase